MKRYGLQDMVRTGCLNCEGCSECCRGMGDTVLVDPYDAFRLENGLHKTFEELLEDSLMLHVEDGVILPNLRMAGEGEACVFLGGNGRCLIHGLRPGLCRAFPLGRDYEDGRLSYFLLEGACPKENKVKLKVEKWLDEPTLKKNQEFLVTWHYLLKRVKERAAGEDDPGRKRLNLDFLKTFYLTPYSGEEDFYAQFERRCQRF